MTTDILNSDSIKELDFKELANIIYSKIAETNLAHYLTVQYATKLDEICSWHIDLQNDQDILDICLFLKGFDNAQDFAYLHSVKLNSYAEIPFDGIVKSWKKVGGDSWPTGSPEKGD